MNRKILLLNLALVAVAAGLGWLIRKQWLEGEAHTRALLAQQVQAPAVMPPPAPAPVAPVQPGDYLEVATKTLYSSDRNPNIAVEPPKPLPPPPPMPALPVYYGQMAFGGEPVVFLIPSGANAQKSFSVGQKIGEFTLTAFNRDTITFDWNGQEVKRKLEELAPKANQPQNTAAQNNQPQMPANAFAPVPAASGSSVSTIGGNSNAAASSTTDPKLGADMGGGLRACVMGDNSPAGTTLDGYKKITGGGLLGMGTSCHWEQSK